ncbi:urease accessory protein [Loktanella fryxellensis]|uniref:Urease accessory protein n=1 Tax=Loktanella fryxellensis TaxID=245187 RepID=A0A1H7ZZW3_9RHOB|nr:HupE/UreJ family protein [Loktanella fryxellensis]SEM63234.1 urease accessory protein [Loktanella fryxellensis]
MSRPTRLIALAVTAMLAASPALAHLDHAEHGSFAAGFSHPLFGLDHILAMIAVGLWAAVLGGRAMLVVPAAFVTAMLAGFAAAIGGFPLIHVEPMILASIIVIGVLIAMRARMSIMTGAALMAVFAFFHGHAHGGELGGAGAATFGAGFVVATVALHAGGVVLGLLIARMGAGNGVVMRLLGGATALAGVLLAFG